MKTAKRRIRRRRVVLSAAPRGAMIGFAGARGMTCCLEKHGLSRLPRGHASSLEHGDKDELGLADGLLDSSTRRPPKIEASLLGGP